MDENENVYQNQNVTPEPVPPMPEQPVPEQPQSQYQQPVPEQPQSQYQPPMPEQVQPQYQQPMQGQVPPQYQQPMQGQYQVPPQYNNPPVFYNNGGFNQQPVHGPVTDIFCIILLVIMPLTLIISMIYTNGMFDEMGNAVFSGNDLYMMNYLMNPFMLTMTLLTYALGIAYIVFVIIDIVKIHKANYKITGLILFAILLRIGYYPWRAHVLGKKMTFPIIYTVCLGILNLVQIGMIVAKTFEMVSNMMYYLY